MVPYYKSSRDFHLLVSGIHRMFQKIGDAAAKSFFCNDRVMAPKLPFIGHARKSEDGR